MDGTRQVQLVLLVLDWSSWNQWASILFNRCKPEEPALFPLLYSSLYYDLHFCILLVIHNLVEVAQWNWKHWDWIPVAPRGAQHLQSYRAGITKKLSPIRVSKWKSISKQETLKPKAQASGRRFSCSLCSGTGSPRATPRPGSSRRSSPAPCSPRAPADLEEQRYLPGAAGVQISLIKMEKAIMEVEQKACGQAGGWIGVSGLSWRDPLAQRMVFGAGKWG